MVDEYYKKNKERIKAYKKRWYQTNKKRISAQHNLYNKTYYELHKDKIIAQSKAYQENNIDKAIGYKKKWNILNKETIKIRFNQRYKASPGFRLNRSISANIRSSLRKNKKGTHWESLVGYTFDKLKKHLEKQFVNGMSWDNYGEWHIDHKIPINVFNFTKPEHGDFKKCWALSNLQPLWAFDNMSKNNKLEKHFQPSLLM